MSDVEKAVRENIPHKYEVKNICVSINPVRYQVYQFFDSYEFRSVAKVAIGIDSNTYEGAWKNAWELMQVRILKRLLQ